MDSYTTRFAPKCFTAVQAVDVNPCRISDGRVAEWQTPGT